MNLFPPKYDPVDKRNPTNNSIGHDQIPPCTVGVEQNPPENQDGEDQSVRRKERADEQVVPNNKNDNNRLTLRNLYTEVLMFNETAKMNPFKRRN